MRPPSTKHNRDAEAAARLSVVDAGDAEAAARLRLEPGVYSLHYLVRSVTPGKFLWPGAQVHLQYAPEEFGRSADSTLVLN